MPRAEGRPALARPGHPLAQKRLKQRLPGRQDWALALWNPYSEAEQAQPVQQAAPEYLTHLKKLIQNLDFQIFVVQHQARWRPVVQAAEEP